ncbi:MAG: nascent polypeptide-associated complex protein [Candidatus Bathyarchaeota archaeon]
MMRKNPREARRLMERMGMRVDEMPDVNQVIIKTSAKEIVIDRPSVTLTRIQGQDIYQIMGGNVSEGVATKKEAVIPEEDAQLVAQQANVTLEAARKALEETRGDLAQAIILLAQRRT